MDDSQYHNFIYELGKVNYSLEKIIELLEVNNDPNQKLTEKEAKKEYFPFRQPTVFEQDGTAPTTGNERPFPV